MKVLIYTKTPEYASSITPEHWNRALLRSGLVFPHHQLVVCNTPEMLLSQLPSTDIVVSSKADLRTLLSQDHTTVKLIFFAFAGVDHLTPFDWVPKGAHVVNNSGATSRAIGEYTIFAIQLLANNLVRPEGKAFAEIAARAGFASLAGRSVTIVGVGGVGSGVASMCKAFRMHVRGVRRSNQAEPSFDEIYPSSALGDAISDADFVVLACPVTPETRGMFDASMIRRMKPGACLINIARGVILDEDALCDAVDSGAVGGAVLDVVSSLMSGPDARVRRTSGVLVTSHVSGDDARHYIDNSLDVLTANLRQFLDGHKPQNAIDFELGY